MSLIRENEAGRHECKKKKKKKTDDCESNFREDHLDFGREGKKCGNIFPVFD